MFGFLGDQFEGAKPVDVPKGREDRGECRVKNLTALSASLISRLTGTSGLCLCPLFETGFHVDYASLKYAEVGLELITLLAPTHVCTTVPRLKRSWGWSPPASALQ